LNYITNAYCDGTIIYNDPVLFFLTKIFFFGRLKLETLIKCEDVILKLYDKVVSLYSQLFVTA
jgi:hypothetical protein